MYSFTAEPYRNPSKAFILHGEQPAYTSKASGYVPNSQKSMTSARLSQNLLYTPDNYRETKRTLRSSIVRPASAEPASKSVTFVRKPEAQWFVEPAHKNKADELRRPQTTPGRETMRQVIERRLQSLENQIDTMESIRSRVEIPRAAVPAPTLPPANSAAMQDAFEFFPCTLGESYLLRASLQLPVNADERSRLLETTSVAASPPEVVLSPDASGRADELPRAPLWRDPGRKAGAVSQERRVEQEHLMNDHAPLTARAEVLCSTPYATDLATLRLSRLQMEEDHLLELRRRQELERIRGPQPKWYERKDTTFHYEARKNNEMVKSSAENQKLLNYRKQLLRASQEFSDSHNYMAD